MPWAPSFHLVSILSVLNGVLANLVLLSIIYCTRLDMGIVSPSMQVGLISFPIDLRTVLITIHAREVVEICKFMFDSLPVNPGTRFRGVAASLPKKWMSSLSFRFLILLWSKSLVVLFIYKQVRFLSLISTCHFTISKLQSDCISGHSSCSSGSGCSNFSRNCFTLVVRDGG